MSHQFGDPEAMLAAAPTVLGPNPEPPSRASTQPPTVTMASATATCGPVPLPSRSRSRSGRPPSDQQHHDDQERQRSDQARDAEHPRHGGANTVRQHGRARDVDLSGHQLASGPRADADGGSEHPRPQAPEESGHAAARHGHPDPDDQPTADVGHRPERQTGVESVGPRRRIEHGEPDRGDRDAQGPGPDQRPPTAGGGEHQMEAERAPYPAWPIPAPAAAPHAGGPEHGATMPPYAFGNPLGCLSIAPRP